MPDSTSVFDAIPKRASWRTYDGRSLEEDTRGRLTEALSTLPSAPFGSRVRVDLLTDFDTQGSGKLGTYGIIKGARDFLVGRVQKGTRGAMEDFGFVFEWAVLQATSLGLGTCWLGGTLNRNGFGRAVNIESDELIGAVSPVGQAVSKRRILDRVMRWGAGSTNRKDPRELFFDGDFSSPFVDSSADDLGTILEMVRLGPSASNKQPWRFLIQPDRQRVELYLRRNLGYGLYGEVDLQRIDMGIALCHFSIAAQALGLEGSWSEGSLPRSKIPPELAHVATWTRG